MGHGPGLAFPRNELVQGRSIRRTASGSGWKHIQELSISLAGLLIVQLLFGGIAAGTVTSDGPGAGSGRKELFHIWEWKLLQRMAPGGVGECLEEY